MMMTDKQKSKVAELKAAIAATATKAGGAPQEVRAAVVALKIEVRRGGVTARVLAAALGIHETTLCRWGSDCGRSAGTIATARATKTGEKAGFRMVRVAPPPESALVSARPSRSAMSRGVASSQAAVSGRSLRVAHAPSGLVVDGLDIDTLAALLRRMS